MKDKEQRKLALRIFRGKKYKELRKAVRGGGCFDELLPIAERSGAIEHWDKFIDEWKCYAAAYCKGITDEMRKEVFQILSDKLKYSVGWEWKGITDKMRREEFYKLDDEWKGYAKGYWKEITDEMRKEVLPNLDDKWKYFADM